MSENKELDLDSIKQQIEEQVQKAISYGFAKGLGQDTFTDPQEWEKECVDAVFSLVVGDETK